MQATLDESGLPREIDWHDEWSPDQRKHVIEALTPDGDEIIAPKTAQN